MSHFMIKSLFILSGILATSLSLAPNSNIPVLAESSNSIVHKGDIIEVSDKILESSTGQRKTVAGKIITPSGSSFEGRSFSINEFGSYKVIYTAYFGYEKVEEVLSYTCQRRAVDFFNGGTNATISYGLYSRNSKDTVHQGVILDMKPGAVVNFDGVFDVSRLTATNALIDFIVDPETIGKDDFSNFTLRLSDAFDSSRYVDMYIFNPGTGVCWNAGTHIRVGYEGSFMGGQEVVDGVTCLHTSTWGTPILTSFHAYPSQEPTHNAQIFFDYENQITYASPKFTDPYSVEFNKTIVNNFKNVKWYKSAVWEGFPSGKVKLSITPGDFSSSSGKMLIKQLIGYDFSQTNNLVDQSAPKITIDYENQDPTYLPKASINKPYKIFKATALDDYDSESSVSTNVYYYGEGGRLINVSISDGTFIPTKEGKYIISYTSEDVTGNVSEAKIYVFTDIVNPLTLSYGSSIINTHIFEETLLPSVDDLTYSGGTGFISLTRTLFDPDGSEIYVENNKFIPDKMDNYKLRFEASDYIGNYSYFDITIISAPLDTPVLVDEPLLPPGIVNGYTYDFPKYNAFETVNGQVIDLSSDVKLFVENEEITGSYIGDISKSHLVGDKHFVTLKYYVESTTKQSSVFKEKEVEIFDVDGTKDKENYFVGSLHSSTKYVTVDEKTTIDGVSLLSNDGNDGYSYFARELDTSYLNLGFSIDKEATNYSLLRIVLIDTKDVNNTITFELNPNNPSPSLKFPGYNSDFMITMGIFNIRYSDTSKSVFDTENKELAEISTNDLGEEFNGLPNGAYVRIELIRGDNTSGDAAITVSKLGNQPFTITSGVKTTDKTAPTIRFDDDVISDQKMGEEFVYPHVTAYDVLSEIQSLTGKVYYNNDDTVALVMNKDMTNTFTITKYGTYDIEYTATDKAGKTVTYFAHVSVRDTSSPEITITNDTVSGRTFGLGNVINIPSYTVSDNLGKYILDMILICPNGERRCLLRDETGNITYFLNDSSRFPTSFVRDTQSFNADMKGDYTIRLIAYDDMFNKTIKDLKFKVN